ncbi:hypothetical protein SPRG_01066 [Saprolegnia parasitica CBS 223.65]|uniref:Uncharacterized protein n=1 Tax=Saprolegnia parasitica (strain CBS 223.65) TaxID=695850 RepID=A0A067CWV7_SAPPC|nr:hypothetical protein SPRG_01066 [Saprolegnia parasitica CBS 223.65]KDO35003.1 hypothetical protein SPRG_01066 [Saprolegnia parasitica CBS 223.65]|eukprot:XP_012194656.1 hypothetical protein SPRG_01066 [Saprolegnia parasitica CBS 223.65]
MFQSNVRATTTERIFLTHLHGDHVYGLPGLVCTLNSLCGPTIDRETKRPTPKLISIYGPRGVFAFLNTALNVSRANMTNIRIAVHELVPLCDARSSRKRERGPMHECLQHHLIHPDTSGDTPVWHILDDATYRVRAGFLQHTVPCFGYVVEEQTRPGHINAALAKARGLPPGPLYKELKEGRAVPLPDGSLLEPKDVMTPPIRGRKVAILGDSSDSLAMTELARNADVLVHESTLPHSMLAQAVPRGHSTSSMAGAFARLSNATLLVLTHFSSRFSYSRASARSVQSLVDEARAASGRMAVVDASDFLRVRVPRHDPRTK